MTPYMYMFVRNDLSHPQQIVQTAHAVEMMLKTHPKYNKGDTNHACLCGCDTEEDLKRISMYLDDHGIEHFMFHESDINAYTAIATQPLRGNERLVMRGFKTKKR